VWHCENDPAASKVLAAHWPGIPNHHDITTTDWSTVELVDILCGGWPCQPFSLAGKRKGSNDERALWPYVAGAVRVVRPRIVVLENVSAVLGPEFSRVANDLAALGYDLAWTCLRAADVGAPHRRERVFILAADAEGAERRGEEQQHLGARRIGATTLPGTVRDLLPTPLSNDWRGGNCPSDMNRKTPKLAAIEGILLPTPAASDATGGGRHPDARTWHTSQIIDVALLHGSSQWGKYEPAIRRWETLTRLAPAPTEPNTKGNPRLSAAFSEWMMGWPAGWATNVPDISRNDALRIIGNGVIPQQATAALQWLLNISEAIA
jgi:DNA (cytosine-5)-methyltransferase 1